jgi:hypothetical protein
MARAARFRSTSRSDPTCDLPPRETSRPPRARRHARRGAGRRARRVVDRDHARRGGMGIRAARRHAPRQARGRNVRGLDLGPTRSAERQLPHRSHAGDDRPARHPVDAARAGAQAPRRAQPRGRQRAHPGREPGREGRDRGHAAVARCEPAARRHDPLGDDPQPVDGVDLRRQHDTPRHGDRDRPDRHAIGRVPRHALDRIARDALGVGRSRSARRRQDHRRLQGGPRGAVDAASAGTGEPDGWRAAARESRHAEHPADGPRPCARAST